MAYPAPDGGMLLQQQPGAAPALGPQAEFGPGAEMGYGPAPGPEADVGPAPGPADGWEAPEPPAALVRVL